MEVAMVEPRVERTAGPTRVLARPCSEGVAAAPVAYRPGTIPATFLWRILPLRRLGRVISRSGLSRRSRGTLELTGARVSGPSSRRRCPAGHLPSTACGCWWSPIFSSGSPWWLALPSSPDSPCCCSSCWCIPKRSKYASSSPARVARGSPGSGPSRISKSGPATPRRRRLLQVRCLPGSRRPAGVSGPE